VRHQRRKYYAPSTGRKLVLLVTKKMGKRRFSGALLNKRVDRQREEITKLAGADRMEWAVDQLKGTPDYVKPGWPNPCKAARMTMGRKAAQR